MPLPLSRVPSKIMQSWSIAAPRESHWRAATCSQMCAEADDWYLQASFATDAERERRLALAQERDCAPHRCGWSTPVAAGSAQEADLKALCAGADGHQRQWSAVLKEDNGILRYVFEPGQTCFVANSHRLPLERLEIFSKRRGDQFVHLGNRRVYDRPDQWVDDFATNLDDWRRVQNGGNQ